MIPAAVFAGLVAAAVPISVVLAVTALVAILASGNTVLLGSVPQQLYGGLDSYGLISLPLFILLGEFMNAGGIGRRLMALALAIIGPVRGGMAYVNLGANMMMAAILGSTVAQITIMSRLALPEMVRAGYPRDISVAITAAAPPMSEVMWCMLAAGLIEMPPVSNVMPLPTSATVLALRPLPPRWASRTSRGSRDEPLPTPTMPP